jgi:energy-converting hydrogenase Eha subunit A
VYLVSQVLEYLIHGVWLQSTYLSLKQIWRPDMDSKMWIMWVVGFIVSFVFAYIFAKGYEGRGIMEGVRFGAVVGLLTALPSAYTTYAIFPIPYSLALSWFLAGMVEAIVLGIVAALVYKPAVQARPVRATV